MSVLVVWKALRWPYRPTFRVFAGEAQPTALTMFPQPCPWAAVSERVDAALHQGQRPEAASRHNTCREEWHEHLPYLRRGGWRKPS